jgi:hypothetical protein
VCGAAESIIPGSRAGVWALTRAQLIPPRPAGLTMAVAKINSKDVRLDDSMYYEEHRTSVVG